MPVLQEQKPAWEARFNCQILLDENAVLSAMTYLDLNPVRAKICDSLDDSPHTSAKARLDNIGRDQHQAVQPLAPVLGLRGFSVMSMRQPDYFELVDHTGRSFHPGKRGVVSGPPPVGSGPARLLRRAMAAAGHGCRFGMLPSHRRR